ncbi:MAG: hypothetical protein CMO80_24050 [Verrucomicrobiales bacterium]|nr:hypothetical protein [Verrucomicrobiales bacterium]|tara:strand:- start:4727 stop:5713 length:987 start_codon:yes stop_codon:yes gene_type:complete
MNRQIARILLLVFVMGAGLFAFGARAEGDKRVELSNEDVLKRLSQTHTADERSGLLKLVGERRLREAVPILLTWAEKEKDRGRLRELIGVMRRFSTTRIASLLIERIPRMDETTRLQALAVMRARLEWAQLLLEAVDLGELEADVVSLKDLVVIRGYDCDHCNEIIQRNWFRLRTGDDEKEAALSRLRSPLDRGRGDPTRGRDLFAKNCATCHRSVAKGGIAPRVVNWKGDRNALLRAIADPSGEIQEKYRVFQAAIDDGQYLTGFVVGNDANTITLMEPNGTQRKISRTQILDLSPMQWSFMPDGLLSEFSAQETRDLVAFLQTATN